MMIEHQITLRLCKTSARPPQRVVVRKGDNGSQVIIAKIANANVVTKDGKPENVVDNPTWNKRLCILHSDNTWTKLPATKGEKYFTCIEATLSNEATASHGRCKLAYFEFFKGEDSLSTEDFDLIILPDVGTETHEEAESYNLEMIQLRKKWDEFQKEAITNESLRNSNESTRLRQEAARVEQEAARTSAEEKRVTDENERKETSSQLITRLVETGIATENISNQAKEAKERAAAAAKSAEAAANAANNKLAELNAIDAVDALDKYQKSISDHMNILRGTEEMVIHTLGLRNAGWSDSVFNPRNYINSSNTTQPNVSTTLIDSGDSPDGQEHSGVQITLSVVNVINNSTPGFAQNMVYLKRGFYTFSVWLKGEAGTTVNIETFFDPFQGGNNTPIGEPGNAKYTSRVKQVVLDTNEWTRVSNTAYYPGDGLCNAGYVYLIGPMQPGKTVLVCMPKLERSKTMTDYAPQPYFGGMTNYLMGTRHGVTLFNSSSQPASGGVALLDNAANYKKLEIYYRHNWRINCVTVPDPNGRYAACDITEIGSDSKLHIYAKTVLITGDTINTYKDNVSYLTGSAVGSASGVAVNSADSISIIRVVGYKDYE